MHFGITGHFKDRLARGAAVLVIGALTAGCSSGAASLTDGLVTNSTPRVRPKVPVGNEIVQAAPQPTYTPAPTYSAPAQPVSSVSSSPLPAPTSSQGQQVAMAPAPSDMSGRAAAQPAPAAPEPRQPSAQAAAPQPSQPERSSAPAERAPTATSNSGSYTVVSGDTLYGISRKTGAGVDQIRQANSLSGDAIRIGQTLRIPNGNAVANVQPVSVNNSTASASTEKKETVVAARATPEEKPESRKVAAYTPPTKTAEPAEQNSATTASKVKESEQEVAALTPQSTGVGALRWPVRGRVVSAFGDGNSDGINIAVPEGTSVHAAENGVVIYSGDGLKGFGNTVLVRHEDGLVTVYGHASNLKVKRGDQVKRGQEIALSGMTGDAQRPQLHFEVRKGTSPVDPMTYLQ